MKFAILEALKLRTIMIGKLLKGLISILRSGSIWRRGISKLHSIEDIRCLAQKRLPHMIYDFISGGAEDEVTLTANHGDFSRITFRPRLLVSVAHRDIKTVVGGQELEFPILVSPCGLLRLAHPDGELAVARAAGKVGAVFVDSTMGSWSIEEMAQGVPGPLWFQLYLWRDREIVKSLVQRAKKAGYQALVVTADVQVVGKREKDLRNGLVIPPKITLNNAIDVAKYPRWAFNFLKGPPVGFRNFLGIAEGEDSMSLAAFVNTQLVNPSTNWDDIDWLHEFWDGPIFLKGITIPEDAIEALKHGIQGIVVSNHGGRQLDGLPSTIRALPDIVEAVRDRMDIILDGGIRRGSDVVKAFAIGANAVMTSRGFIWGLSVAGEAGVKRAFEILEEEIDHTLALLGRRSLREVDRSSVDLSRL